MKQREQLINNYIEAYNNFDIDGMIRDLSPAIKFENISNGEVNMVLDGVAAFKQQATQAKDLFKSRQQTVTAYKHTADETEIDIAYHAVLAIDLPNGLKSGDELNLTGRSVFKFTVDKIIAITDIS